MALSRNQQFYSEKLSRGLTLAGSETTIYVTTVPTETRGYLIINPRSSLNREKILYTGVASGPARLTGVVRGLPFATVTGTATSEVRVEANCVRHSAGEPVEISPGHYEAMYADVLNGTTALTTPMKSVTPTAPTEVAIKSYVDGVSYAGTADASTTAKGIVERATQAEVDAGTDAGGTTAPLFAVPSNIAAAVQKSSYVYAADAEASDAYVITLAPAIAAYATGLSILFKPNTVNTGAATINVNGLGAKSILKDKDVVLEDGDLKAGGIYHIVYDGINFQLQTPPATTLSGALATEAGTFFGGTNLTYAQANILNGGSIADDLHHHKKTSGVTTVLSGTSTTQNIAHGLGVVPWFVKFISLATRSPGSFYRSDGSFDGTTYACISNYYITADVLDTSTACCIRAEVDARNYVVDATATLNSTNIVLTWSSSDAASGTLLYWEAYA